MIKISNLLHLFTILLEDSQLKALLQFGFLDLPELKQLLLSGMDLVKKLHDLRNAALHVRIAGHVAGGAVPARIAGIVTVATLATGKPKTKQKHC